MVSLPAEKLNITKTNSEEKHLNVNPPAGPVRVKVVQELPLFLRMRSRFLKTIDYYSIFKSLIVSIFIVHLKYLNFLINYVQCRFGLQLYTVS